MEMTTGLLEVEAVRSSGMLWISPEPTFMKGTLRAQRELMEGWKETV